ncbi:unnamed protein product [Ectocarpus sp. CCAP 1310/34]|nr:unnamed protein product [Ectocarpus sp. CCAP 1310/34]
MVRHKCCLGRLTRFYSSARSPLRGLDGFLAACLDEGLGIGQGAV